MRRNFSVIAAWLLPLVLGEAVDLGDGWSCQAFVYQEDVWMRSYFNGAPEFDFRIGNGGVIEQLRYCASDYEELIAPPSYPGSTTDRVIQVVWWDGGLKFQVPNCDPRYNINQAGTSNSTSSPTMRVDLFPGNCSVRVYSVPQDQWCEALQGTMPGRFGEYSEYQIIDAGALSVRKVVLVGKSFYEGQSVTLSASYVEHWSPFLKPVFDSLALGFNNTAQPDWYYRANYNIPDYPAFPVTSTNGYATVYNSASLTALPSVSYVFGVKEPILADTGAQFGTIVLNSMEFDQGICILPGLNPAPVPTGYSVDWRFVIYPNAYFGTGELQAVQSLVQNLPPPTWYLPNSKVAPPDVTSIVTELISFMYAAGVRTDHLGTFV